MKLKLFVLCFGITSLHAKNDSLFQQGFKEQKITPIAFTENKGQVYDQNYEPCPNVLYGTMVGNMAVHIKNSGVSYQLYRVDKYKEVVDKRTKNLSKEIDKQTIYRIDLNWLNVNKNITQSTDVTLPGYNNYYTEGTPDGGALNVKSYTGITLHNLYNGISLHYYEKNGNLKHDYIIAPHTSYKQIQVEVKGAEVSANKDGSLFLTTPLGKVIESAPVVYQQGKLLKAKWIVNRNVLSFEIENYNPNYELIIDPVTRLWGSYYGGSATDEGRSCSADASGNVYMAGYTQSNTGTVIATAGSHQTTFGGFDDAFLVKFNSSGVRQWGTYYGGSLTDQGYSCSADASGNVYLAGWTSSGSSTVMTTVGAHQTTFGGFDDAFLVKFNSLGVRQWGTYYGGTGVVDWGHSCCTDAFGNVYLAGETTSNTGTVIATTGAHQTTHGGGGGQDAFLVKFNGSGVRQWGTYYGGSGNDEGFSCSADASGNVYLSGTTLSGTGTVIASPGAHQTTYGGSDDAFLVKFNTSGIRQWGTYYGGSTFDEGFSCSADATGDVYLAGSTQSNSGTVIATAGAHQATFGGGADAYIVKMNSAGIRQWGTYYGGSNVEVGYSCSADAFGNVYLAGYTQSNTSTVIATTGAHQTTFGGVRDALLVKFNSSGVRQSGSYYGGAGSDEGRSCNAGVSGDVYLAGFTASNTGTLIANSGSHQSAFGGGTNDAFLVKFDGCTSAPNQPSAISGSISICSGSSNTYSIAVVNGANFYTWSLPGGWTGTSTTNIITTTASSTSGSISVVAGNGCGNSTAQNLSVTVNSIPSAPGAISGPVSLCANVGATPYSVTPVGGATSYTWSLPGGWSGSGSTNTISATPGTSGIFTVTASNLCGTSPQQTLSITVNALPTVAVNNGSICSGQSFTMVPGGASTYTFQGGNAVVSPTANASYTVVGTNTAGCVSASSATSNITVASSPTITVNSGSICSGNSFTIVPNGANTYTIQGGNAIVSPTTSTSYTVAGTNTAGCVSANPAVTNITVNPLPTISASTSTTQLCIGSSATLTASGGSTYTWSPGGTGANIVISPTVNTTYTLSGTDANGCNNTATLTQTVINCSISGLSPFTLAKPYLAIYPNPFSNKITVVTNDQKQSIQIFNALGSIIYSSVIINEKTEIDLSHQSGGIYFIRIGSVTGKIIKE